jgi:hypothetical protein
MLLLEGLSYSRNISRMKRGLYEVGYEGEHELRRFVKWDIFLLVLTDGLEYNGDIEVKVGHETMVTIATNGAIVRPKARI